MSAPVKAKLATSIFQLVLDSLAAAPKKYAISHYGNVPVERDFVGSGEHEMKHYYGTDIVIPFSQSRAVSKFIGNAAANYDFNDDVNMHPLESEFFGTQPYNEQDPNRDLEVAFSSPHLPAVFAQHARELADFLILARKGLLEEGVVTTKEIEGGKLRLEIKFIGEGDLEQKSLVGFLLPAFLEFHNIERVHDRKTGSIVDKAQYEAALAAENAAVKKGLDLS